MDLLRIAGLLSRLGHGWYYFFLLPPLNSLLMAPRYERAYLNDMLDIEGRG